ncbi:hypothetical protein WJX73_003784 [Symbiochloris irregularis]|uniref:Amino acid transporter n=1 Tax=Symbiochloris irregularis TaxID=706552 RepID=A0AAW1PQ32_9CHLO
MTDVTLEYGLKRLGLKQEYKREFSLQASFCLSFVIMSPFVGVADNLGYSWYIGGPGAVIWGWKVVSLMTLCTGLSLAEILSGLPCSGGPYYWTSLLGGRHGALLSYITGWCNLVGLMTLTAGSAVATMYNVVGIVQILTGVALSTGYQVFILQGVLVASGLVNCASPTFLTRCMYYGAFINVAGVISVVLLLPTVGPWRQSPKFVWGTFFDRSMSPFTVPSNAYLWIQGAGLALFTLAGFDSCSHLSEEIKGANSAAPLAMLWSILATSVIGFALLLGLLFCVQDPDNLFNPQDAGEGYAAGQLVFDVFKRRFGSGTGCVSVLLIFFLGGAMCTIACVTSTSRMMFAFARSRALPFSCYFSRMSPRQHMPVRTVWLAVLFACAFTTILLVPGSFALVNMISFGFAGMQLAHGLPILCRLTISRHTFVPGPIHLGRYSGVIGWISVAWVIVSMIVLSIPPSIPVTADGFQMPLLIAVVGSLAAWYCPWVGARHTYIDPKRQAASANLAVRH